MSDPPGIEALCKMLGRIDVMSPSARHPSQRRFVAASLLWLAVASLYGCSDSTTVGLEPDDVVAAVPALEGVEVDVLEGVAPYDHASAARSVILRQQALHFGDVAVLECVNDQGFSVPLPEMEELEAQELYHGANAEFPYIDALARDGFAAQSTGEASGTLEATEPPDPPPGAEEAAERCWDEDPSPFLAEELWGSPRRMGGCPWRLRGF